MSSDSAPTVTPETATVSTYSGRRISPFDPDPAAIHIPDVAHALAQVCRCAGQSRFFYSVGLHSLYVAEELAREGAGDRTRAYGILHDAAEAYLADVPGPVKHHLPGYQQVEAEVQAAVWRAVDLPQPDEHEWARVKAADRRLRRHELPRLFPDEEWPDREDLDYDLRADDRLDVPERFERRTRELVRAAGGRVPGV